MVVVSGQFERLAKTIIGSQDVDESIMVLIGPNPECVAEAELVQIANEVLAQAARRLTASR